MPRFIAVHPGAFPEDQLRTLAREKVPEGVIWNSTYVAPTEGRTYCLWEAPTKEAVLEIFTKYQIPYDVLHEVRRFDPAIAAFEAEIPTKVLQPA
jgi:hypothetical protein